MPGTVLCTLYVLKNHIPDPRDRYYLCTHFADEETEVAHVW